MYKKHTEEEWATAYKLHMEGYDSPSISRLTRLELSEIGNVYFLSQIPLRG